MVQKIALLQTSQTNGCGNGEAFVYMVLGIDDPIKRGNIIYNHPLDDFLQWSGMSKDDLWETTDGSNQVLWHAKIHPIVTQESYMSLFAWLVHFSKNTNVDSNDTARLSLDCWKSAPRLSLADIREASNALTEFSFRTVIIPQEMTRRKTAHLRKIEESLLGRKHEAIDLQFAVDSYAFGGGQLKDALLALHGLDRVTAKSFADAMFDVCGRACMVSSTFLLELEKVTPGRTDDLETHLLDKRALESISGFPIIPHGHADSDLRVVGIICSSLLSRLRQPDQACTFEQIAILRDFLLKQAPGLALLHLANLMESIAHFMTQKCVAGSQDLQALLHCKGSPVIDQWVLAAAPARVDLAGGWSDTPPICFEFGGAVTGIAVKIDNMKPLVCRSRIVLGCGGGILLRTEHRGYNCELRSAIQTEVRTYEDMYDFQDPTADCTLLKCALICLGFVNPSEVRGRSGSLQSTIDSFCGVPGGTVARLEIVSSSMVPHGSGLGTSSILGGCVLAAMGKCVGIPFGSDYLDLIRGVLILEQYLTTGGGWQDQINGLLGGAKIATCNPYVFPLDLSIEQLELDNALVRDLDTRLFLVFTGKTRLAKNLLGKALGRWSKRTPSIVGNLSDLVEGAKSASDALVAGDLDSLGTTLSSYWEQKKLMCGQESGVEPIIVSKLLNNLKESKMIRGGALCGAGGGGFLVLLLQDDVTKADLAAVLNAIDGDMSLHKCTICKSGLKISVLSKNMQDSSPQFLDPSWLSSESD
jgi:galactokinase/mevalonate kinase-like predicted kinase